MARQGRKNRGPWPGEEETFPLTPGPTPLSPDDEYLRLCRYRSYSGSEALKKDRRIRASRKRKRR